VHSSNLTSLRRIDVSVVIPTHGRPNLLERAVRSALAQTHSNLEVVVVLDGPDGCTPQAVARIGDPRVSLIALATSVGGAEARNVGVRAASGRYVALLDDDDEWLPNKLARQLALADICPSYNFVVVTQYLYRLAGHADELWPGHLPAAGEPLSEFLFSSRGGFQTSTYLCTREFFLANPFTAGLKKHQDWDWFLRIATLPGFRLLVVPEPLSVYWVPLRSRSSVSGNIDWRFSASWAKSRTALMTPQAYSTFLVKICLRSALIQREGRPALGLLLRELFLIGRPTPLMLGDFLASITIPETLRLRLRYGLVWLRRLRTA
jgi:glycosyltransferase involved in cell wall biosynthesis